jgi:DNA repair protein RecO (recombination protein O)
MPVALQPAFVLHRRPYRNTSLLLEVFSRDHGRVGLVARGVRTPRSRLKGLLQPFTPLRLSWSGRGDLMNLVGAEESAAPIPITPARAVSGLYLNELLLRLLQRHDPYPDLFEPYRRVLETLTQADGEERGLRIFEKHLLAALGYGLLLDSEALSGAPIQPRSMYRYVLDRGPIDAERRQAGITICGSSLLALAREEALDDPTTLREIKRLTRAAIAVHLQGRPLKTRELLREVRALS